jgi:sodium transport system ATP-binding protein
VRKTFATRKSKVEALKGVSFRAEPGKIYGLLGPNGAGKTTCLRCIATLLKPDGGNIHVNEIDTRQDPRRVRDSLGFLTSDMKLSGNLSVRETLRFFGNLNHLPREEAESRIEELASYLDMKTYLDRSVEKLSTGMKQKANIAVSLIHNPEVIIFDEPTAGLDILAAKSVVDFLYDSKERGKTVILSTHIMSEAEKLCDEIGILLNGELVTQGSRDELVERHQKPNLEEVFFQLAQEKGVVSRA